MTDQNEMTFADAPVQQDTLASSLQPASQASSNSSTDNSDMQFGDTPVQKDTPASSLPFTTPLTVVGQHADTGKDVFEWNKNHPGQPYGVEGTIRANDPQNAGTAVARWAEQVANDVKYGTDFTGIGKVLKKMGAHGVYNGNSQAVGDWMASIPLGALRAVKGAAESEGSQGSAGGEWQALKDVVGGTGQAIEMPTAVIAPENAELEETAGQALDHAGELASGAVKAGTDAVAQGTKNAASAAGKVAAVPGKAAQAAKSFATDLIHPEKVGQEELQEAVRSIAQKTAAEAGPRGGVGATGNPTNPVEPDAAATIRDVFSNLSKAVEARAQAAYKELDAATGGNVSRFDQQLKNVENAIRNSVGLDEDADAALETKKNDIMDKMDETFKQAEANGVPRQKVDQARADWRQKSALNDLDNQLKKSTPVSSKLSDTQIDPNKFRTRITNMHDSGRLHEAIGADNADALRDAAVKAAETRAKAVARQKIAKVTGKAVGYGTGMGVVGDIVRHAIE